MLINEELLYKYGASIHDYLPSEAIFKEGQEVSHYYQIQTGLVKLNNILKNKEKIESVIMSGESVCNFLCFTDQKFPVNAITITKTTIIKISKHDFDRLIKAHEDIAEKIQQYLAKRVYNNFIWMRSISSPSAEERLKGVLDYFKNLQIKPKRSRYLVPFSRGQLAAMTGLRLETVIRTVKKMEERKLLIRQSRKIYY